MNEYLPAHGSSHGRVNDRVKDLSLVLVVEDDRPQFLSIEIPVRKQNSSTKVIDDLC